ncbi:Protein FAM22D [Heterocephalus glaber]|uniref:Protein FAM22D n=1 Tax=Heterocephalus glaber TaxID=10181 RepID=G5CA36_HETGA|nr:Protein FAM22D [Heterocephalus glaber]
MILKSGVIPSPTVVLRPLPPASVPVQQLHWEPPPPPFGNAPLPRGKPLVLSPFPMTPVMAGHGNYGKPGAGPFNITAQARRARRPAGSLPTQSTLLTQAPRMRGAPGVRHWAVQNPSPLQLRAPPMTTFMPTPIRVSIKVYDGMWPWGLCPSAIPPVAPAMSRVNTGPPPHCNCTECGLAASQANASPHHTCKSPSVYENFRRWQYLKTLLREHLPQTPDMEAVSCFLVVHPQADRLEGTGCLPPAPKSQQPPETKAPDEIPPEAVKEYKEIMAWLEEHHLLVIEEPEENQEEKQDQEEDDLYPDILSYCDQLCSQEEFVNKVEDIINPKFLEEVESTDVETDIILAVSEVLEEEHALTLDQLVEKRLLGSKTKGGVCRPQSQGASRSAVHQGAEQDDCDPKRRVNKETCPAPKASQVRKRCRATDEELPGPEVPAVLCRRHRPAPLRASGPSALPQDLAPQGALGSGGASPSGVPCEPTSSLGEDDRDVSSLSFLLASPRQLLPWARPPTPEPGVGLPRPAGPACQASPPQGGSLSPDLPPSARSKKRVLTAGVALVGKVSRPGPSCQVSGGQDLAQGLVPCPRPKKRRCNKLGSQRRRKTCPP